MAHLLTRNIRVEADLVDQLFNSSEKRLARMLLILANLGSGDFFGEGCLAGQPRRMATAVAMANCLTTRLDKAAMIRLLQAELQGNLANDHGIA